MKCVYEISNNSRTKHFIIPQLNNEKCEHVVKNWNAIKGGRTDADEFLKFLSLK